MPKFGTSGLRGLAVDLTDALAADYVHAFLSCCPHGGRVLVGRDLRASSPRLASAVASGAQRAGVPVTDCGILPTPALASASLAAGCAAVMVTGSHIPADRNGLKFYTPEGEITKAHEADILARYRQLAGKAEPDAAPVSADSEALSDFRARYAAYFSGHPLSAFRIGVYQHSSVARDLFVDLLQDAGAEVVALGRSETFIPVDTEAVDPGARELLAGWARDHRLDAIVSTDGDADRPMLTDATGKIVPGDLIGPLAARYLGAREVVTPVSSNTVVEKCGYFDTVSRCRIGSPYVIADMEALIAQGARAVVGYEANGGFLLGFAAERQGATLAPLMTRDFALPVLALLSAAAEAGTSIADLVATLPPRFTAADRLTDVDMEVSKGIVAGLLAGDVRMLPVGEGDVTDVDTTDGARLTLASGRVVHIRPSGNAPELRCYVEAETSLAADGLLAHMLEELGKAAEV